MVLIKNLTQSQIANAENFRGEVITNADTNKLMFNTGTNFTYLVYSDLNNVITGLSGISATNITGTLQTPDQPNITSLGTLEGLTVNNNLVVAEHNGVDTGLTLGGDLVTSSANQLNYVNTTPGTAEPGKALITDSNNSIVGLTNLETDNLTVNGTLVTSSAIELNYVDVDTLGQAYPNKALVLDENKDIVGINTLEADYIKVNGTLVTSSAIELNYVDVNTLGTAEASKALVVDANRDIGNIRNLTADNLTGTLQTAAQPNVTSLGDLTGLKVTGHTDLASLSVNGVPLDAFNLGGLKMRVYSNTDFTGRVIKADIIDEINFTDYEPATGVTENYSMEIWGYIKPLYTENYIFTVSSNDKFRLWINNELVKVAWTEGDNNNLQTTAIPLVADSWYPIYVQHAQIAGTEKLSINWSSTTQVSELLPASSMAYDDKMLNITSKKSYTQDSLNLYDGVNSNISTISTNPSGDLNISAFSNLVNIPNHNGSTTGLKLNGTLITSTAEELNYVDTTVGSAEALKAVVLDLNKDTSGIRNVSTVGTIGVNTSAPSKQLEINSATGDVLRLTRDNNTGTATEYADMTIDEDGKLTINSSGNETIIHSSDNFNIAGHNGSTVGLKLNDVLVTSTAVELNYVDTTPGTAEASKALVLNADRNISNVNFLSTSTLTSVSTDDSTSVSTGAITTAGGVGIAKNLNVGGATELLNTTNATNADSGALVVAGGAGIKKALYVGEEGEETTTTTTTGGTPLGSSWTDITPSNISKVDNAWLGMTWSETDGKFVVVGSSSEGKNIIHSADGSSWSSTSVGEYSDSSLTSVMSASADDTSSWRNICWSPELGIYVAVSNGGGISQIMTSADGTSWTSRNPPSDNQWYDVCWSPELSLFVSVAMTGTNRVMTSPDGITWTARTSADELMQWYTVCWSPQLSLFVSLSIDAGANSIMTSSNGITWTSRTNPLTSNTQWLDVCWSPELSLFVAVNGQGLGSNHIITSPNGIDWTARNAVGDGNSQWCSICWSPLLSKFVVVSSGSNSGSAFDVMYSSDGINWTGVVLPTSNSWVSVVWSPEYSMFVAVAKSGTDRLIISKDGISWSYYATPNTTTFFSAIAWSPQLNKFTAIAYYSTNAPNYRIMNVSVTEVLDTNNTELFDVVYASGLTKYVAVGKYFNPNTSSSKFITATSANGSLWTYNSTPTTVDAGTNAVYSNSGDLKLAYSSTLNRLVAVGKNVILTSTDGNSWTETRLTGKEYTQVIWAAGTINKFVLVGDFGAYATSSNGTTWTHQAHSSEDNFENVAYSPTLNKFIIKGMYGSYSSTDGLTWNLMLTIDETPIPELDSYRWKDMQWVSAINQFVAVGYHEAKTLITSSDGITWTSYTGIPNVDYQEFAYSPSLNKIVVVSRNDENVRIVQSTYVAGVTTTTTITTPADGYFNLKGNADILGGIDVEGVVNMNNTTQSTSTTTGALVVDGGVGIGMNLTVGGNITVAGDTYYSGNLTVEGPSLRIPVGDTSERPVGVLGQIRYNNETSQFEGFGAGNSWGSLGGVTDVDQDTRILAETSAGDDNDELRFYNAGAETMRLTNVGLLGLGTTTPSKKLEINSSTGDVLRMTYNDADGNAVNYADMTISSDGKLTINSSGEETIIHSSDSLNIDGHNGSTTGLKLAGTLVTSTATELNYVDTTPGAVEASKAVVVNADRNISNVNDLSLTGDIVAVGTTTTSGVVLSSADVNDYSFISMDTNYTSMKTSTGFQWNTGAEDGVPGVKIMELDSELSMTVPQNIENTTDSTNPTTGALKVAGGVGIAKSLNVGQNLNVDGNVDIDGPSLRIPVGDTDARPVGELGQIRYNSETSQFEGFGAGNSWGSLGGVSDVDQDTKILAETAAGDDNDELRFYNAGLESMRLTSSGLLGLGTTNPNKKLEINSATGDALRLTHNDTDGSAVNYVDLNIDESGNLILDSSGNETTIHSSDSLNVAGHNGSTMGLKLAGVLVTSTATELNYVDTTPGTAEASKALVVDADRNISNIIGLSTSTLTSISTTESTSVSTGAITTAGGVGIAKNLNVGGIQKITNLTNATNSDSGALVVNGGVGIKKALYIGEEVVEGVSDGYLNLRGNADIIGDLTVEGTFNMNSTAQSTSTTTGALVVDGGVGIAKNVNIGENLTVGGDTTLSSNVVIDGPSLRIPVGNTSERPVGILGQIRYNNETSQFEGFGAGNSWGSLGGVTDVDQDTKITAETAAGDDNDELRFYNAGAETMRLTNVGLMGLGTSAPSKKLEINSSTGDVLRLTYDDSNGSAVNYADMTISSDGKLTINSSGEETIIHSSDSFNIAGHDGTAIGLKLAGVLVTSTATELNYLDTTPGAVEASKAMVMDANRDINNINVLSADTINVSTFSADDLTAENINTTGNVGINTTSLLFGLQINEATGNVLRLTYNDNTTDAPTSKADFTMDDSNNLSIAASNSVNIAVHNGTDKGLKLNGTLITSTAVELNYVDTTPGTAEASKALVLNSSKDISGINSISMNSLNLTYDSAVVDTQGNPLAITRTTSGTPANGLGVGMSFKIENSINSNIEYGNVGVVATDITSASEDANFVVNLMTNGVMTECMRLSKETLYVEQLFETSDRRVKENFEEVSLKETYDNIMNLKLTKYNYIGQKITHTGLIAQEVEEVIPVAVNTEERNGIEDFKSVSNREITNTLLGAVQYLSKKLEELSAEFKAYKDSHT